MRYKKSLTRDIIIFLIILLPTIILIFTLSPFEWDETISATAAKRTVPMAMCMTDENDRFCVVGYTENDDGSEKGFIAIYDIWGDLSLKKYWISDYNLHFNAVTHWGDTFIITGYKYSSPTNKDIVFVRISTTGEKQWEVTWDNSTNDVGVDIAKSESSIWVLGNYLNSSGAVKSVLLDLSANSKIKRTCYPFLNSSEIESLNCTSLDFVSSVENFVIAGSAKIESLDRTIVFTCKETDMSIQWYKTSTSSVATVAKDVDYDDNIYVTGYSSSNGLLIERYDELGTLVWEFSDTRYKNYIGKAIVATSGDHIFVVADDTIQENLVLLDIKAGVLRFEKRWMSAQSTSTNIIESEGSLYISGTDVNGGLLLKSLSDPFSAITRGLTLFLIIFSICFLIGVLIDINRVRKKAKDEDKRLTTTGWKTKTIEIKRGFEIAEDTFRFFIRVDNKAELAITNVSVRIQLPTTLKLDQRTLSNSFDLGKISPKKFGTAIFYIFCEACADTEINAIVEFMDPMGDLQILKMEPFKIFSCKYIRPRELAKDEFTKIFKKEKKQTLHIGLKEGITDQQILKMIKSRMTMSTVDSSSTSLEMAGLTTDGKDILLRTDIEESEEGKVLVVSIASENPNVQMGAMSDIIEEFKSLRREMLEKFEKLEEGQEEIKETIIEEVGKVLENQIQEFNILQSKSDEITAQIEQTQTAVKSLESIGESEKAEEIKKKLDKLRKDFKKSVKKLDHKIEDMAENMDKVLESQDDMQGFLMDKLGSDFDRIKDSWKDYKNGEISRKQLIFRCIKIIGIKVVKQIIGKKF